MQAFSPGGSFLFKINNLKNLKPATMKKPLTLGYSTCPNDTFIFYALAHRRIDCESLSFDIEMADVELLNQAAHAGRLNVTKLSFAALGQIQDRYALLKSGAALGRGCGPLIVANPGTDLTKLADAPIALPGLGTTAYLLLCMFLGRRPNVAPMVFDQIMPAIQNGRFQAGVIIHEGRFTFQDYGLICLQDLGQWWEEYTGLPIPLGGIAIQRSLPTTLAETVEKIIEKSVRFALRHPEAPAEYIRDHAAEMDSQVIKRHIDLYVNRFSVNLGKEGKQAVETLFRLARQQGAIPQSDSPLLAVPG
jgi:1,4-dihydroxy-6-naphthoate synthase